jgi:hypothetical protein
VDDIGKILKVKLIKFGAGYSIDFLYNIGNTNIIGETTASEGDITILPEGLEIRDRVGLTESGYIVKHTYTTGNYMNGTYVGEVIGSFGTGSVTTTTENRASLLFTIGSIAKYPGYYLDNKGFLSDSIKLQDSKYYQVYSYVIKIDKAINEYADVVRNLVHPAGLALFAEYDINNSFDISNDLEFQMAYIRVNLTTITSILDDQQIGSTKILGSHVMYDGTQDNNKVEINDSLTYVKENISEGSIYNVTIQDTINLVNDGNVYNDPYIEDDYIENGYILDGYSNGYVQGEDAYVEDNSRPIQN